jgi:hypothetical protein
MSNITNNGGVIYIQQSGINIQYQINSTSGVWNTFSSWPVTFVNSNPVSGNILTVSITTNITISNTTVGTGTNGYFITGSSYITYDGTGKTITIANVSNYPGLISNGSSSQNGFSNVTVENINNAISGSSTLALLGGWVCQSYFGKAVSNIFISNCSNSGNVNNGLAGGICGGYSGESGGILLISTCYNTGILNNSDGGGIGGYKIGRNGGNISIINCYNTGNIIAPSCGGICSSEAGYNNGSVSITDCTNSGIISGNAAGGICGSNAGYINGTLSIKNSSNTGNISGNNSGGICGSNTVYDNEKVSILKCYNTGIISGTNSGGITGDNFGSNSNNQCSIINCYNIGAITGSNAGGITGASVGYNDIVTYTPNILIEKCYSLGDIATTAGGICGGTTGSSYDHNPIVQIKNCYTSYDSIAQPGTGGNTGSQYISLNLPTLVRDSIILTNVYSTLINNWTDSTANTLLTGTPTDLYSNNPGSSWAKIGTNNTLYLLSGFNSSLYTPSIVNNLNETGNYTSSAGLFTPDYNYNLISVNNAIPPSNITINNTNGVLTFTNLISNTYIEKIFCYKGITQKYYGYNFNTFTLNQVTSLIITQNGGTIYLRQLGNQIQYKGSMSFDYWSNIYIWPLEFINSNPNSENILTISIITDITISDTTTGVGKYAYFISSSEYITYDGGEKTITISNVTDYPGLIQNGLDFENGYSNITVQNINSALSGSSTLANSGGWICQNYFSKGVSNNLVNNCYNSGAVNNSYCGGICGRNFAQSGNATIKKCSNTGFINNFGSGGICGGYSGNTSGTVSITNCSNAGTIGDIVNGGICGTNTGYNLGKVSITRCSNTGIISGNYAGGICGDNAIVSLTSCSNTGLISGTGSGGITGSEVGYNNNNLCSIINCYNTGNITGSNAGGITGSEVGYNNSATYTPNILIQNCYSLANIATTCGGICGGTEGSTYSNIPIVNITNCYTSYNTIADSGSEYVSTSLQTDVRNSIINRLTNVYTTLTNNWADSEAKIALTGTPKRFYLDTPEYIYYTNYGLTWYYKKENNTPYFLISFLNSIPKRIKRIPDEETELDNPVS